MRRVKVLNASPAQVWIGPECKVMRKAKARVTLLHLTRSVLTPIPDLRTCRRCQAGLASILARCRRPRERRLERGAHCQEVTEGAPDLVFPPSQSLTFHLTLGRRRELRRYLAIARLHQSLFARFFSHNIFSGHWFRKHSHLGRPSRGASPTHLSQHVPQPL